MISDNSSETGVDTTRLAGLRSNYPLFKEGPKHFCTIYRILGNDLPPLHGSEQSLVNTRFILANEPKYADTQRIWIISRLVDKNMESRLVQLLESHDESYILLPFELQAYRSIRGLYENDFSRIEQLLQTSLGDLSDIASEDTAISGSVATYQKMLYVFNVNEARNLALADGIGKSEWIIPLDGANIIPPQCWSFVSNNLAACDDSHCLLPVVRPSQDTDAVRVVCEIRNGGLAPMIDAIEIPMFEPQVIFNRQSRERFDELLRYGKGDKQDLIARVCDNQWARRWRSTHKRHEHRQRFENAPEVGVTVRLPYRRSPSDNRLVLAKAREGLENRCEYLKRKVRQNKNAVSRLRGRIQSLRQKISLTGVSTTRHTKAGILRDKLDKLESQLAHNLERLRFHDQALHEEQCRLDSLATNEIESLNLLHKSLYSHLRNTGIARLLNRLDHEP